MVQVAAAASVAPQVVVSAKSEGFAPVIDMPLMVSVPLPGLESVMVWAAEVVPDVAENVSEAGDRLTCGAVPVPVSATVCVPELSRGEVTLADDPELNDGRVAPALSATEMVALSAVALAGVKVTEIVQVVPAGSALPQLFVWAKLLGLVPVTEMPLIVSVAVPGFDSVIVCAAEVVPTGVFAKASEVGVSTACGVGTGVPVPVRVAVCGEPVALSATLIAAVSPAVAVAGVKVTEMVQVAAAASESGQLFVWAKLFAFAPVTVIPERINGAPPGFESWIVCAAEVAPTVVLGKVSDVGVSTACGPTPVPVSGTFWGEPVALSVKVTFAENAPTAGGVNVTITVQLEGPSVAPHALLKIENAPGFAPVMVTLLMFRVTLVGLLRMNDI
jgi:hypothetical protein